MLFFLLPPISPWLGIPLCILAFVLASIALGLMKRTDLELLRSLGRERMSREPVPTPSE